MITFAIIRHPEVKLPPTLEQWVSYYQHLYKPSISAQGEKDAIRIAKTVDDFIKKYLSDYQYGTVYHSHTLRCKQMSEILAKHGPFTKSLFEPGLSDPIQSWTQKAIAQDLAGKRILNHDWWVKTSGLEDKSQKLKTESPEETYKRVIRALKALVAQDAQNAQNVIIGLVLPSVLIQLIVGYLTGIDIGVTTAKFPFDKASLTLVCEDGKLFCSNVKL